MNNENNPHIASVYVGTLATDNTQVPLISFAKKVKITGIKLINNAAIAASDTDYVQPAVKYVGDSTQVAEGDSRAAHEGALTKNTPWSLNLSDSTGVILPAGTSLEFDYQEAGTVTLTAAVVQIEYSVL